ncbi:iron chelate uptake ABC transporter family permease subunit [Streptomyces sp. NPDC029041]|uniref:iron chelate uptake ABC transporter family permease subunit n=1 Tax=Streptomyces sp. NPDC029041 TaxID=3155727 RepID=UPI0033DC2BF4
MLFRLMGDLGGARWANLTVVAVTTALAPPLSLMRARALDALLLGEKTAASLGLRPSRPRTELFVSTSLLIGALVAVSGAIGFAGLKMPLFTLLLAAAHLRERPGPADRHPAGRSFRCGR